MVKQEINSTAEKLFFLNIKSHYSGFLPPFHPNYELIHCKITGNISKIYLKIYLNYKNTLEDRFIMLY